MTKRNPGFLFLAALIGCFAPAQGDVVLRIDLNAETTPSDTAPNFTAYVLSGDTLTVGPYTVDVNPAGGAALTELHQLAPASGGALTLGALYRDSIATGNNTSNYYRVGLDAEIGGLTPRKRYTITAWSYDSGSTGTRTSDWSILGLNGPQFAVNDYAFNASVAPVNDTSNRFTVTGYADANGRLVLRGRPNAANSGTQVYLNGFTVEEHADAAVQLTPVLAIEINDRAETGPTHSKAGFSEFLLEGTGAVSATTRTFGSLTVTMTGVNATLDDRPRTTPVDSGAFTEGVLYRGFAFASATTLGSGIDVRIQGLTPNQTYLLELWSYDAVSGGARTSDWTVNSAPLWDDYVFNGSNTPQTNNDYKMSGAFTANATGELLVSGRVGISVAGAPAVFLNALRISQLGSSPIVDLGRPIISEFLADNNDGITDEDGDSSDWIEIWNTTSGAINLGGWHLTDDPALKTKWTFPANVIVPSQERLIVWASGKNRTSNPAALHTSFALSQDSNAYLALYQPGGGTVATIFTGLPSQRENISYGLSGTSDPLTEGYFAFPTPDAPNGATVPGFVSDTTFSVDRGFYSAPFNVQITCATVGAAIYYTTDGSEPTTSSAAYPGAAGIPISTTTVLRAKAFKAPLAPSDTDTQTYIFNAHVAAQPAAPAGWPASWGTDSAAGGGPVPANYEMDPNVVNSTLAGYGVSEALGALPAFSVVLPPADFHSQGSGIYANPRLTGDAWERACSLELLELDGGGFHTNAGIRVHGNSSRTPTRMQKHSFRLAFRAQYGDGRLNYKLYDDTTLQRFDRLVLHACFTDGYGLVSWDEARYRPHTALSFRDAFMKKCFADMGHAQVSGRFSHLYVNGLYWGVYRIGERIDDEWCADHYGGANTDWDVIAFGEGVPVRAGTSTAWDTLFTLATADLTVPANYAAVAAQLDLADFIDYYLLHVHGDSEDWPHHNGYAVRNRVTAGSKWKFVTWDQEIAFDPLVLRNKLGNTEVKTPAELLQRLRTNPEFRLLFADRAHKHLNNDGALSIAKSQARWQSFATQLDKAIVAESARWGDTADETPYGNAVLLPENLTLKRETHWLPQVNLVKNSHIPSLHNRGNANATIPELSALSPSLWPSVEPPVFGQFGGNVAANYALTITAPAGSIYYTLNGIDPREAYTGAAVGTLYSGPVALGATCTVKARALSAGTWSAVTEAKFIVGIAASSANLAVTEMLYNPANADHEFLELTNFSATTIDLTGVHFFGITFTFPDGTLLASGERIVVVRNAAAFEVVFGNTPRVAGQYSGALDNNGEVIAVIAANGTDIVRFRFDDEGPWPALPINGSRSIVLRSPSADPTDETNWRMSAVAGGTPGGTDSVAFVGNPLADGDHDGLVALIEHFLGTSDTVSDAGAGPVGAVETFTVGGVPASYLTLTARVRPGADDVTGHAELSEGLGSWDSSEAAVVYVGEFVDAQGTVRRKWRAAEPISSAGGRQYFRLRVDLP